MPFPFLPFGALVAAAVMILALTGFALALRAMDRAATRAASELRLSIVPGVVSGLRRWAPEPGSRVVRRAESGPADGIEIIDLDSLD